VRDERIYVDLAVEPALDEARHPVAALHAAERRAGDAAARDEVARHDVERLALARDAAHRGEAPAHPSRLDRLAHDRHVAGRLEGVVGAEAVRQLEDALHRVGVADERLGRALSARKLEPVVGEVDADDPLRALEAAARDRAEADHAGAEDDAGRAGLHFRGVHRRAEAGREAAGEEASAFERRLAGHLRERDLGHHGVLGERRGAHEVADRLAARVREPGRPVRKEALVLLLADREAEVRALVAAVEALAALRREERDDVVARLDRLDPFPDLLDDAGTLVPEHRGRVARRVGARGRVEVGVADAARDEADERLAGARLRELHFLHRERRTELLENGGADLHLTIVIRYPARANQDVFGGAHLSAFPTRSSAR
jgi:hypothetical protein